MPAVLIGSIIALQGLLILVHLTVYKTLSFAFGIGGTALYAVFFVLSLSFILATLLARSKRAKIIDWLYAVAMYWFGLVHFLFVGALVFFFAMLALSSANVYVAPGLIGGIAFGAAFLLHIYGTWKSGRAEVTAVDIALPGLPTAWEGKKAVFVSDLHLGNIRKEGFMHKVVQKIMALSPEAVFIGGDLYDGMSCDVEKIIAPLSALKVPQGMYFITGNHEYYLPKIDFSKALAALRAAGVRILENERVDLHGITLAGVNDSDGHKEERFKGVLKKMSAGPASAGPAGTPSILLKHEPRFLEAARDAGYALVLAGHTHGGQIFPLNYVTRAIYKGFDYGLKRLDGMQVFTSSGAGTWAPPLRLGTKSEIVCITFRHAADSAVAGSAQR